MSDVRRNPVRAPLIPRRRAGATFDSTGITPTDGLLPYAANIQA